MTRYIPLLIALFAAIAAQGETVYLYNDNGRGGIHRTAATLVVDDGQYFVDVPQKSYDGKIKKERLKVYRIKDEAYYLYHRPKWAAKYVYVAARPLGFFTVQCYYFNMKSKWRPSLTQDPDDPNRIIPVKWIMGYYDNEGAISKRRLLVIRCNGKLSIYSGDDMFSHKILENDHPEILDPAWTRQFRYYTDFMPPKVFFNLK